MKTGNDLAAQIDGSILLHEILKAAGDLTDSPDGSVILYNEQRKTLYFADAVGENSTMLLRDFGRYSRDQVPIERSIAGVVFTTGSTFNAETAHADPDHYPLVDERTKRQTESLLCVPLVAANEVLGVMQVLNKRSGTYTLEDEVLLEHFANQAAIALRNARLFEDLLAHTGLHGSGEVRGGPIQLMDELKKPAHYEDLSLMFVDMRGFTRLSRATNHPEELRQLLNAFHTMLSEQVFEYKGVVNKFLGDGLMAFFRQQGHEEGSVRCAFSVVDRFAAMREQWRRSLNANLDFLDVGIGIVTDKVIVGTIGSSRIRDYTVIGIGVNLAAALVHQARGGKRILVSQRTLAAVEKMVIYEDLGVFELKKPDQPFGDEYDYYHLQSLISP